MPYRQPDRKHPVHGVFQNSQGPTIIFLTVCSKNRVPWIADHAIHKVLREAWMESTAWLVGNYVLMPDHVHLFITPMQVDVPLENWVRYWKSRFTWLDGNQDHSWQTDHWDTRLRSSESFKEKWCYVRNNPVRTGLVDDPDDWPFQGEIYRIGW